MAIFAISDLHLSYSEKKPMDIFGRGWEGYMDKIRANWIDIVRKEDTVLVPGDISWAMQLDKALDDLRAIDSLPGQKIILKGNHDYWWDTTTKIKNFFDKNGISTIQILHNNSFRIEDARVFGTRGWILKNAPGFTSHDQKIYNREIERLKLSFSSGDKDGGTRIAMFHYPPIGISEKKNEFTDLIDANAVDVCIFGHIHSAEMFDGYNCVIGKTSYRLVSSDYLRFIPFRITRICG